MENFFTLPLTIIMVEDPKSGGYTAFFKQFPDILAEGNNEREVKHNLLNTVHDVFRYQSDIKDETIDPSLKVSKESINFISHECV